MSPGFSDRVTKPLTASNELGRQLGQSWQSAHPVLAGFSVWTESQSSWLSFNSLISRNVYTLYLSYLSIFMSVLLSIQGKEYRCFLLSLDAYESAKMLCEQYYLGAPELELREMNGETIHIHMKQYTSSRFVPMCVCIKRWLLFCSLP